MWAHMFFIFSRTLSSPYVIPSHLKIFNRTFIPFIKMSNFQATHGVFLYTSSVLHYCLFYKFYSRMPKCLWLPAHTMLLQAKSPHMLSTLCKVLILLLFTWIAATTLPRLNSSSISLASHFQIVEIVISLINDHPHLTSQHTEEYRFTRIYWVFVFYITIEISPY